MHQTTVRFGPDLWEALETECGRLGVSAAHYLREAAVARLAYTAGRRGDADYEDAFVGAGVAAGDLAAVREHADPLIVETLAAEDTASEQQLAAVAVSAQAQQVMRRAREVRAESAALRRERARRPQ